MIRSSFQTVTNNGDVESFKNACMFISIKDFLHYHCGKNITVDELRKISKFNGKNNSHFDINKHHNSLIKLLQYFKCGMYIYYANCVRDVDNKKTYWLGNLAYKINDNSDAIIPIVAFKNHFELLISETTELNELDIDQIVKHDGRKIKCYK